MIGIAGIRTRNEANRVCYEKLASMPDQRTHMRLARPSETLEVVAGRAPKPVSIRMEDRGTFRGRLLEAESGNPIPGGRLFLDAGLVLTTDARGRFEVGGLARKNHEAFVVAPGRMRLRVLFDTTARADTELDVPVARAGKLVGRVTDADGKPVPGAYVGRHTSGSFFSMRIGGVAGSCVMSKPPSPPGPCADHPTRTGPAGERRPCAAGVL